MGTFYATEEICTANSGDCRILLCGNGGGRASTGRANDANHGATSGGKQDAKRAIATRDQCAENEGSNRFVETE